MATRVYQPKIEAVGGILLPAGAAAGRIIQSDASGNFEWVTFPKKSSITGHTWAIEGLIKEQLYPGFFIKLLASNEKKLVGVEYFCTKGEVEFELRRKKGAEADAAATGFTTLKATETITATEPAAITLASKDLIRMKVVKLTTAPENLTITAFVESIV